jgi:hypothetical protein
MNDWDIHRVSCSLDQLRRVQMEEYKPVYMAQDMTLRDYFAAKAMQGVLANGMPFYNVSEYAYKVADLMMEERDK